MLVGVSDKSNVAVLRALLAANADFNIKDTAAGDSILHLACRYGSNLATLQYLCETMGQHAVVERNKLGDTPVSIATELKKKDFIQHLDKTQKIADSSKKGADALMKLLEDEEKEAEAKRQNAKNKNYKRKLKELAKRDNLTVEET
jgi:ankyrin repeat protein